MALKAFLPPETERAGKKLMRKSCSNDVSSSKNGFGARSACKRLPKNARKDKALKDEPPTQGFYLLFILFETQSSNIHKYFD